jgi:hypothetical protein
MEEAAPTPHSSKEGMPPEITKLIGAFINKLTHDTKHIAYANNVRYEANIWDLRIIFGHLQEDHIDWHTTITVPWAQVKLMTYYLRVNAAFHERGNDPVRIPVTMKPDPPAPPTEDQLNDPSYMELFEAHRKIYTDTFGEE